MIYKILIQHTGVTSIVGVPEEEGLSLLQGVFEQHASWPMDYLLSQWENLEAVLSGESTGVIEQGIGDVDPLGSIYIEPDTTRFCSEDEEIEQTLPTRLYGQWMEQFVRLTKATVFTYPSPIRKDYLKLSLPPGMDWGIWLYMRMESDRVIDMYVTFNRPFNIKLEALFNTTYSYDHYTALSKDIKAALSGTIPAEERNDIHITGEFVLITQGDNQLEVPLAVFGFIVEDWLWFIQTVQTKFDYPLFQEKER